MKKILNPMFVMLALFASVNSTWAQTNNPADDAPRLFDANDTASQKIQILVYRANIRAQSGRFHDAAADLSQTVKIDPSNHAYWYLLMPLLIQSGEIADYKTDCKKMLEHFQNTTNPEIAERTAKSCLLLPSAIGPDDFALAVKLAESSVTMGKGSPWFHWFELVKGLAEYRQGDLGGAVKQMQRIQNGPVQKNDAGWDRFEADTYFVLAMARQQLKESDKAHVALAKGREIVRAKLPKLDSGDLGEGWWDVLMTYIFMHEAEGLIDNEAK